MLVKNLEDRLFEIIKSSEKKVVFWGASIFLEKFLEKQSCKFENVIGIIDNNSSKWDKNLCGYTIYPVEKLATLKNVLVIFTIQNNAGHFYNQVIEQINSLENHTISISTNIFALKQEKIDDLNNIYVIRGNTKQKVNKIVGLDITFAGSNNTIEVGGEPLPKFAFSKIHIEGSNNIVKIDSSIHPMQSLTIWVSNNNSQTIIGKNFSCLQTSIVNSKEPYGVIRIGEDCMFSNGIHIRYSDAHTIYDEETKEVLNRPIRPVEIGNHVWVCNGVSILKNSKISDNSVVGKSSVVTKCFDKSNVIIAGVPAKIIKEKINWDRDSIYNFEKRMSKLKNSKTVREEV